jgi:hypothetical protein
LAISLPMHCPMTGGKCNLESKVIAERLFDKPYCFVMVPFVKEFEDKVAAIRAVIEGGHTFTENYSKKKIEGKEIKVILAKDRKFIGQGICKICQLLWFSDFGIAELGMLKSNVMIEIGWLMGLGKRIIFTLNKSYMSIKETPFDLGNPMLITYNNTIELANELEDKIKFLILTWGNRDQKVPKSLPKSSNVSGNGNS